MEIKDYEKQYPEHYDLFSQIVESVNNTSHLINKLGELPQTGVENIDLLYTAFYDAHMHMINMFIEEDEGEC